MTNEQKYEQLKTELVNMGIAVPGTIRKLYLRCGNGTCKCMTGGPADKHGPYYFWDRKKKDGKLSSMSINKADVPKLKEWIKNRRLLEKLVRRLLRLGMDIASKIKE